MSTKYAIHPVSFWLSALFIILSQPAVAYSQNCQYATQLVKQSYEYGNRGNPYQEKRLLKQALRNCPHHADAHNNLASILENEGNYQQAIYHYKQALKTKPNFSNAWNGLGETYYKQGQFPLSLEAHLHACKTDKDSRQRVLELLKENRYALTEKGQILNKKSLLILYDKQQRDSINKMILHCALRVRGKNGEEKKVEGKGTFRNVTFHTGLATLKYSAKQQIKNLAAAFNQAMPSVIKVHGHTDKQTFKGVTNPVENDRLNLILSQKRALAVKRELVRRGIRVKLIQTQGYGSKQPLERGKSKIVWAKNRRVEIESVD